MSGGSLCAYGAYCPNATTSGCGYVRLLPWGEPAGRASSLE